MLHYNCVENKCMRKQHLSNNILHRDDTLQFEIAAPENILTVDLKRFAALLFSAKNTCRPNVVSFRSFVHTTEAATEGSQLLHLFEFGELSTCDVLQRRSLLFFCFWTPQPLSSTVLRHPACSSSARHVPLPHQPCCSVSWSKAATGSNFFQTHLLRAPSCTRSRSWAAKEQFDWTSLEVSNGWFHSFQRTTNSIWSRFKGHGASARKFASSMFFHANSVRSMFFHTETLREDIPGTQQNWPEARKHQHPCTHGCEVHLCSQHVHLPALRTINVALRACPSTILFVLLSSSILHNFSPLSLSVRPSTSPYLFRLFLIIQRKLDTSRHPPRHSSRAFLIGHLTSPNSGLSVVRASCPSFHTHCHLSNLILFMLFLSTILKHFPNLHMSLDPLPLYGIFSFRRIRLSPPLVISSLLPQHLHILCHIAKSRSQPIPF